MSKKRLCVLVALWISGLFVGALFGPQMHVLYWSTVLDRNPSAEAKIRACWRLSENKIGRDSLYNHLKSRNKTVRSLSGWWLASVERPDVAAFLFTKVPKASETDKLDILRGMSGVPLEYSWMLASLRYELKNNKNSPRVKTEISELLRSMKEGESHLLGSQRHPSR